MLNLKLLGLCAVLSAGCLIGTGCHDNQSAMDAGGMPDTSRHVKGMT